VKVRYKQAVLGASWALFQPAVTMIVFTFVFGRLANMPSGGIPYPLLVMAGLLPWQLFSSGLSGAGSSLVTNSALVSKVYFPRLIIPMSALAVALVDFAIAGGLYASMMLWFGVFPTWRIIFLPVFTGMGLLAAFGVGTWLTALTVRYRDFRFITPFILQIGVFLSPIGYSSDNLASWQGLLSLNPMTGIIDGFRWCLLGENASLDPSALLNSAIIIAITIVSGVWYFRSTERTLADVI
jgi:lipopolysaccharide transport system permease protein